MEKLDEKKNRVILYVSMIERLRMKKKVNETNIYIHIRKQCVFFLCNDKHRLNESENWTEIERERDKDSEREQEIGQNKPNSIKTISHKVSGAYENCLPMWQVDSIIRYN